MSLSHKFKKPELLASIRAQRASVPPSAAPESDPYSSEDASKTAEDDETIAATGIDSSADVQAEEEVDPSKRPSLSPFFTLIEDATTGEHYHPTVHYIFSDDDDADLVTEAALRLHEGSQSSRSSSGSENNGNDQNPAKVSHPINERYILLTVSETGTAISSAQSMNSDWQILNAEIGTAPTWDGAKEAMGGDGDTGLMLRVEGTEGVKMVGRGEAEKLGMDGLVDTFGKRMDELRKVVERWEGLEGMGLETERRGKEET
ncbi:hypothetical protein MMC06_001504 [Schaereria dolodes]|nr:hypothetical protein [Schaereria dolodes]